MKERKDISDEERKDYIELTFKQIILLGIGTIGLAIFVSLWLNGYLYEYGI